jgi:nicotinate-nucleotide adenylyltransferase
MKKQETLNQTSNRVYQEFVKIFGQTPLRQRNDDILNEAIKLSRFTTIANLKEEHGDLLCSLLTSFKENGWDPIECIENTLTKLDKRLKQYHTYGRKISVAIYGGAFDPITNGHIAAAELLLNSSTLFDQVWITPCYKHLYGKKMAETKHRLEMCRLATCHDRRIQIFDYEIKNKLGGETYHFVKKLLSEDFSKNQYDFSFIIGMDNANSFDKWLNFEDLEKMIRFVVVPRTGVEIVHKTNWYLKPPHMFIMPEHALPEVSSTMIRNSIINMKTAVASNATAYLKQYLHPDVFEYIIKNKLYSD